MRVLIACEYSGRVRDAFAALGHDAWSCDLLPSDAGGNHYQCDIREVIDKSWDLVGFHPPCTFLNVAGIHWNNRGRGWERTNAALEFVRWCMSAVRCPWYLENPVSIISSAIRKPDQYIQPYNFGDDASKNTGLWLSGLPKLRDSGPYIEPRIVNGKKRWANQTDSGQNKVAPGEDRWKERSTTYLGIARAIADQWGKI